MVLSLPLLQELVVALRLLTWFHVGINAQRHRALMWETAGVDSHKAVGVCGAMLPVASLRVAFKKALLNATT